MLSAPQPLVAAHQLADFECGEPALDAWLKRRAMNNQLSGASRSFVVLDQENQVRGFYTLAAGAVAHQAATRSVRHNMPDPVSVISGLPMRSSSTSYSAPAARRMRR